MIYYSNYLTLVPRYFRQTTPVLYYYTYALCSYSYNEEDGMLHGIILKYSMQFTNKYLAYLT